MINHSSKTHAICFHMALLARPATRETILREVYLNRYNAIPFKKTSNHCYFARFGNGNGGEYSLIQRGYIRIACKHDRRLYYVLTPKGRKAAKLYHV